MVNNSVPTTLETNYNTDVYKKVKIVINEV